MLAALRAAPGPLGVTAISAATHLSANAVRFHLARLLATGAVRAAKDPGQHGPGRPLVLYSAAPAEAVDPASAYRVLAGLLARELTRSAGPAASVDAGRAWARRMHPGTGSTDPQGLQDPVDVVLTLFADTGFQPTLVGDGRTLHLHRCPFRDLAVEQPEVVCGVHQGLVNGVLDEIGADLTATLVPVQDGSGPCRLRLDPAPTVPGTTTPIPIEEPVP